MITRIRIEKMQKLFRYLAFFLRSSFIKSTGGEKKYPTVIQLPITKRCNSRCVMCDIWKTPKRNEVTPEELGRILKDSIFKEVRDIGVNGGEPSMLPDLLEYIDPMLALPKIKNINIISNGFMTETLLNNLERIKNKCSLQGIKFHVSISLDGVGEVHDKQRGVAGAFLKTTKTLDTFADNRARYCDSFDIACTVTKINVDFLVQLDRYAKTKHYPIKYRLGIANKRIGSNEILEQFSVLDDTLSRQSAKEFFHYLFCSSKKPQEKYKYFCIFHFLREYPHGKRLLPCAWKEDGITLDSEGNIYYCAVASEKLGSLKESEGEQLSFAQHNLDHRRAIVKNNCSTCIHDYHGIPHVFRAASFLRMLAAERFSKW